MTMETSLNKGWNLSPPFKFFCIQCYLNQIRFQAIILPFLSYFYPKRYFNNRISPIY